MSTEEGGIILMKKFIIVIVLLALLAPGVYGAKEGQDQEKNSGIDPDSPFYFLDKAKERVELFLASDKEKAKLKAKHGYERLAEAKRMFAKDKPEEAKKLLKEGMANLSQAATDKVNEVISKEDIENLKNNLNENLAKLQEKLKTEDIKKEVKNFFNFDEIKESE